MNRLKEGQSEYLGFHSDSGLHSCTQDLRGITELTEEGRAGSS